MTSSRAAARANEPERVSAPTIPRAWPRRRTRRVPALVRALLAFAVLALLRVVVGLTTLGTFAPVLLAFGYTQAGAGGGQSDWTESR